MNKRQTSPQSLTPTTTIIIIIIIIITNNTNNTRMRALKKRPESTGRLIDFKYLVVLSDQKTFNLGVAHEA